MVIIVIIIIIALHLASTHGFLPMVEFLVDQGANINAKNADGMTPLHLVIIYRSDYYHY